MKLIVSRPGTRGMAVGICERSMICPGVGSCSGWVGVGDAAGDGNGFTGDGRTSSVTVGTGVVISAGFPGSMGWKGVGVAVARGLAVIKNQAVATGCAWAGVVPRQPARNMGMAIAIPR